MGVPLIEAFCERFKVPNDCSWLAKTVARDHTNIHNFKKLKPNTIGKMFARWDILRHPERALQIMNCCTADGRGRGETHENNIHPTFDILPHFVAAWLDKVDVEGMVAAGVARGKKWTGQAIGEAVLRERVRRLTEVKKQLEANV
jgi:tRNA nucleotidyltransferase (CCA-adding enzyme)